MSACDMTDEELLTDYLKTKKEELYTEIDERMRPRLYALGLRLLRSPEKAEDAVQDVLFKLLEMKPREFFPPADNFLFRVLRNLCIDKKRAEETDVLSNAESIDFVVDSEQDNESFTHRKSGAANFPDKDSALTEAQIKAMELQAKAQAALATLPSTQREAIELYHCRSMSAAEAAEILKIKEGTVEKRVEVGIKCLRQMLEVKPITRPTVRPIRATDPAGDVVHEFPAVKDAVNAGFSSNRLYQSLKQGKPYKGLTWSYASAT